MPKQFADQTSDIIRAHDILRLKGFAAVARQAHAPHAAGRRADGSIPILINLLAQLLGSRGW